MLVNKTSQKKGGFLWKISESFVYYDELHITHKKKKISRSQIIPLLKKFKKRKKKEWHITMISPIFLMGFILDFDVQTYGFH